MGLNVPTSVPLVLDLDERLQPRAEMRALGSKEEFERRARCACVCVSACVCEGGFEGVYLLGNKQRAAS
jgi:hypothetical protein